MLTIVVQYAGNAIVRKEVEGYAAIHGEDLHATLVSEAVHSRLLQFDIHGGRLKTNFGLVVLYAFKFSDTSAGCDIFKLVVRVRLHFFKVVAEIRIRLFLLAI